MWTPVTSLVAAHNITITLGLALNGMCAYALALRSSGSVLGALAAGILFGASAAVQVRALGHINLVHAWVLPLFALTLIHLSARPSALRAVMVGVAAAAVVYTDYYYAVYAGLFTLLWTLAILFKAVVTRLPRRTGRAGWVLLALLAVDAMVVVIIASTGGTALDLGFARVSLRGLRNPLTLLWFLAAVWALWRHRFMLSTGWRSGPPAFRDAAPVLIAAATFTILATPLLFALGQVVAAGDYTTQTVLWRSSPPGGDLLTMVLGHPRHLLTGEWTRSVYTTLGIDVMEQALWIGLVPLVMVGLGARGWRSTAGVRVWGLAAVAFSVIALGPFLRVGGLDTALILPDAMLRYVPVFSNARIPGRAVVMVQLAVAVLLAHVLMRRSRSIAILLLVLVAAEALPARLPVHLLAQADSVDDLLRTSSVTGAVAEMPLGVRVGFGHDGVFDHRALAHQMTHGRPLVGGFVARLAPGVRDAYAGTPILKDLLFASTPSETDYQLDPASGALASAAGIAYLVVNRDTFMDVRLSRDALERAGFRFVHASGARELYETGGRGGQAP